MKRQFQEKDTMIVRLQRELHTIQQKNKEMEQEMARFKTQAQDNKAENIEEKKDHDVVLYNSDCDISLEIQWRIKYVKLLKAKQTLEKQVLELSQYLIDLHGHS
ncbi:hypothetical protein RFI_28504 [Reticulomyxa filosa]|uniref:Uncharacterized protein n=1 Tax=Reticulomyxa filosa TaxID=46433 RepID=X6M5K7_RETFI|nr:hypothetical protein RFI_28504 [Reticulomyxa filosa]|eukprot:ETO08886.1 hypothetical protein RFI_28504 [Reticulomyxa filosa]